MTKFFSTLLIIVLTTFGVNAQDKVTEPDSILTQNQDVTAASFSPDGSMLASGSWDKSITLYHVDTTGYTVKHQLKMHGAPVIGLCFSRDNKMLASIAEDNLILVWDTETGQVKHTFKGHTDKITGVVIDPSLRFVITSSMDKTIRFWDMKPKPNPDGTKKPANRVLTKDYPVLGLTLGMGGKMLYVGNGSAIEQLNITGRLVRSFEGHTNNITGLDRSIDKKYIASMSADRTIMIWDIQTGKLKHTLKGHTWDINSIQFSLDSKYLVSCGKDGKTILWDVETGAQKTLFEKKGTKVTNCASISADEKTIAVGTSLMGSPEYGIVLWNSGVERVLPKRPSAPKRPAPKK